MCVKCMYGCVYLIVCISIYADIREDEMLYKLCRCICIYVTKI